MAEVDWSLSQTPNFGQAALAGYQAGQTLGKQRRADAALQGIDLTKPETIIPLLKADPATGAALLNVSSKFADAQTEAARKTALSNYLTALQPGQEPHPGAVQAIAPGSPAIGASGIPATPASGDTPAVAATPAQPASSDPNAIVVNAPKPAVPAAPDLATARAALIQADPDNYLKIQDSLATMGKNQRQQVEDAANAFGNVIEAGKDAQGNWLPPAQLKAVVQANRASLIANGVDPAKIDSFDGSAQSAQMAENQVLGVKGILEHHDKVQQAALEQARFGEQVHHDRADEANSAANVGIAGAHLGIERAHLALDQQAANLKAAGGAGGAPMVQQRILPNGTHAYRNPANGKWYDNAAFK